jgi:hypothetical protein
MSGLRCDQSDICDQSHGRHNLLSLKSLMSQVALRDTGAA